MSASTATQTSATSSTTSSAQGGSPTGSGGGAGAGGACVSTPVESCPAKGCACESVGLVPLTDMGTQEYMGEDGGLYGGGANLRPPAHEAAGLALAQSIEPVDAQGNPDPNGTYALISVGMSNTTQEFQAFLPLAQGDSERDAHLAIVDGAQGGQTAAIWSDPNAEVWNVLAQRLQNAGVSAAQVAVAFVKQANAGPSGTFPSYAQELRDDLRVVLQNLHDKYPNLRLAYLSSRIYGGYATTSLNPEPYAYEGAFSVRWLVREQIEGGAELNFDPASGAVRSPWISWGPYLWSDGLNARCDGLTWACTDLSDDGTHPSPAGREKVAKMLHDFFRTDTTARQWYLANP